MDFGELLNAAKKNSENVQSTNNKFYSTKFAPPKKESKVEKKLSDNIKKFLEKKEKEEQEKNRAEKLRLNNLLAMRDEKSKNKIRKMLKVTKSANRSVLDDVDGSNMAVMENGLAQPDEDDYGYVSNAAAELFKKYVDKVGQLPEEKHFSSSRPATIKDLSSTKDRVKAAILREQEEKSSKTRTSTTSANTSATSSNKIVSINKYGSDDVRKSRKDVYDPQAEKEMEEQKRKEETKKAKLKSNRPAPPPLDFQELLKLAEKKQFEPVEVKTDEKKKEPERLLTKKEKQELEERKKYLEEKERRKKLGGQNAPTTTVNKMQPNGRIPKLNNESNNSSYKPNINVKGNTYKLNSNMPIKQNSALTSVQNGRSKESHIKSTKDTKTVPSTNKSFNVNNNLRTNSTSSSTSSSNKSDIKKNNSNIANKSNNSQYSNQNGSSNRVFSQKKLEKPRENPPKDIRNVKEFPPKDIQKTREFPPKDIQKTRQFPPLDVRRSKPEKKPMKRRILDDDEEYDSEMDDFIDDGPQEEYGGGYSKYIQEIFGYDKSRYRDEDYDDGEMESSFAQQMREETISKKIGLMEDLEDMKMEAADKKRKMEKMKKMRCK